MTNTKRIILLMLTTVLLVLSLTACGTKNSAPLVLANTHAMPEAITFTSRAASTVSSSSVRLTATVLPAEASNKKVDWSIEWGEAPTNGSKSVTDYVTVTPESDGSATATVTCKKAFGSDKIIITVTTRIGGFKAQCTVSYLGTPTGLSIETTGAQVTTDSSWNVSIVNVYCGSTYNFDLNLTNQYGQAGSFTPNYTVSIEGVGTFEVQQITHSIHGTTYGETRSTTLDSYINMTTGGTYGGKGYLDCSIVNGKLNIRPKNVLSNLCTMSGSSQGSNGWYFKSVSSKLPYVKITVTETNTGLTKTINVHVQSDVTSVSLTPGTLQF